MSRSTRNLALALAGSVLLNVFALGVWAGRFVRREPTRQGPDSSALETDSSASLRSVWSRHDAGLRTSGEAVAAARRAVRESLVAEPFDAQALEASLARLRTESDAAQQALHRALVEAARELSVDDRRRLAASRWFLRGGPRRDPLRR